ncbi:MAG: hypothetical protein KKA73_17915 [Chloroflexi bacterium]|nr:hypothetical protein [Chloroflexota bacterium]MBU1749564.1 hypothetical protein [Chloroflexota bacterium]
MGRSKHHPERKAGEAATYQVRVLGTLDDRWSDWFEGMTIRCETGSDGSPITTLIGPVVDQVALRGVLARLWDLNMTLLSAIRIQEGEDGET